MFSLPLDDRILTPWTSKQVVIMSLTLAQAKRTRNGHRIHVRRLLNDATELAGNYTDQNAEHRSQMKYYKSTLTKLKVELSELDATILSKVTDKEIEKEITESAEVTDEIGICLAMLEDITCAETEHSPLSGSQENSPPQAGLSVTNGASNSKVRLPKLHLPVFDGKFKEWSSFWDKFDSAINSNVSLTAVEKFSHLRASLQGSAAATINGLSLTSANYDAAVVLLKER